MTLKAPILLLCVAISNLPVGSHGATLSAEPGSPTTDLLLSRGDGEPLGSAGIQQAFGFRNADAADTEGTRGRGQTFVINSVPGAAYDISSLSVALGASGDDAGYRPDGMLTLTVFELGGTDADDFSVWSASTGGTSGTQLFSGSFDVPTGTSFAATDFLTVSFDPEELILSDGIPYGFFFRYVLDSLVDGIDDPLNEDVTIAFDSDNEAPDDTPGALLSTPPSEDFATAINSISATRDLNYFITGTAGDVIFAISDIEYDPATNMVTLEWDSRPGETFAVKYSLDLSSWTNDLDDGISADPEGETTREAFDLSQFGVEGKTTLFFRVEKLLPQPQ